MWKSVKARQIFYWEKLALDIENYIKKCEKCQTYQRSNAKEPLINHPIPTRAWQSLSSDIFKYKGKNYVILVDAYLNWIEVGEITNKSAETLIRFMKNIFTRLGVPDKLYADNNPYNSLQIRNFAKEWNFEIIYSSPYHSQSNGLAEKTVGIVKNMLKKCDNRDQVQICLMQYRNSPLPQIGFSPAQLL